MDLFNDPVTTIIPIAHNNMIFNTFRHSYLQFQANKNRCDLTDQRCYDRDPDNEQHH